MELQLKSGDFLAAIPELVVEGRFCRICFAEEEAPL